MAYAGHGELVILAAEELDVIDRVYVSVLDHGLLERIFSIPDIDIGIQTAAHSIYTTVRPFDRCDACAVVYPLLDNGFTRFKVIYIDFANAVADSHQVLLGIDSNSRYCPAVAFQCMQEIELTTFVLVYS